MKKILIAYDGSTCAEAALEDLTRAGLPPVLEAVVLSVADVWLPVAPEGGEPALTTMPHGVRKAREQAMEATRNARGSRSLFGGESCGVARPLSVAEAGP